MKEKLAYVTKKQVTNFINSETKRLKINKNELIKEVENLLCDLKQFPNDNKNQIKFFSRVYKAIV